MTGSARDRILKDVNGNISDHLHNHIHLTNCIHLKNHMHNKHSPILADRDDAELSCNKDGNNMNREKRLTFRGARRNRPQYAETRNEMSVASNSYAHGKDPQKYRVDDERYDGQNVTGVPRNGCGIPWNWSRVHHRGKSFFVSCGLSESGLKKEGSVSQKGISNIPAMLENLSSATKSNGEAFPLLLDAFGSQKTMDHGDAWLHDYSGELGIFADNLLKQEIGSEGGTHEQRRLRRQHTDRHQNLTQKYMPKTFKDIVGQNLVVQALLNAIVKRKVGLLYVFYGPHGTGKTTCSRIFARALNCQSLEDPKPCGLCDSCVEHEMGKSHSVREISPVSNINSESIIELFDDTIACEHQSHYKVFIFDECDTFSSDCWSAILKVVGRALRRVVFVLVCSRLDVLPHVIISRCQKFVFTKLKDAEIIYTLQWIATKEDLEIDKDALKLIASRSDGSLRDAEMTLEQLSLLGQQISLCLVQELVGLISEEKLVELLDLALSADTVKTVKSLRDIMESGVEPLALMSQLATVITDILAGSYDIKKERPRRKFFQRQGCNVSREDMENLRQALKTLSEAEKQLRVSNDRMTWLTAVLLQLAPDQQYMQLNDSVSRERPRKSDAEMHTFQAGSSEDVYFNAKSKGIIDMDGKEHVGVEVVSQLVDGAVNDRSEMYKVQLPSKFHQGIEEIWLEVLEKIPINSLREFMYQEGKLISLSYGAAPTLQLLFNSQLTKSEVEKYRSHILQAFESVLRSPVTIEIRCESRKDIGIFLPTAQGVGPSHSDGNLVFLTSNGMPTTNHNEIVNTSEIVEVEASPRKYNFSNSKDGKVESDQRKLGDKNQNLNLVRGKISLGHVIHHAEGCSQHSGWSTRKDVSITEKLEQENLRLEPRSRGLVCWHPPKTTRPELSRLKIRTRKPQACLKFVSCGRCYAGRSPS